MQRCLHAWFAVPSVSERCITPSGRVWLRAVACGAALRRLVTLRRFGSWSVGFRYLRYVTVFIIIVFIIIITLYQRKEADISQP